MRNGKTDRTFEPQIYADGRGWGKGRSLFLTKGRTFEPQIHVDGRGWGKGRFTIGIATARTQVAVGQ